MSDGHDRPGNTPPGDDLGDLFDYDIPLDDILPDAPTKKADNSQNPSSAADGSGLGLDEEVKITKTRQPVAKLDENRLLSQQGIPKLRKVAKSKLKFKGKGHEFSDAARLLNFYQLWLDDLFPRAKFADGLAIIEKLGHSRRLQTMRKQWIDDERPMPSVDNPRSAPQDDQGAQPARDDLTTDLNNDNNNNPTDLVGSERPDGAHVSPNGMSHVGDRSMPRQDHEGEDDADQGLFLPGNRSPEHAIDQDIPEHDELDELLREQEEAALSIA
ncbi:hypothetical protein PHISCL_04019 [Aspergillus sclerotialis]|uniref:Chromosome segregation in meiosis protein n=1 Tax=Aspergillus sclerotialis TaxID=2070753 RepID=A0A3A2ZN06_9EURO|nr:hypothetical protein PHISCL_04019 [Aspergillus sclerotialis]